MTFLRHLTLLSRLTERSLSSLGRTSSHMTEVTGETQQDAAMPLYNLNSPPLSPNSINLAAHPAKGVLKHSISQDSECSGEILTKKVNKKEKDCHTASLWCKM